MSGNALFSKHYSDKSVYSLIHCTLNYSMYNCACDKLTVSYHKFIMKKCSALRIPNSDNHNSCKSTAQTHSFVHVVHIKEIKVIYL